MESSTAKEFLISKIVEESKIESDPLSDTERKMLYFTESFSTAFNVHDVHEQFERSYDNDEYETKIVRLLRSAHDRDKKMAPHDEEQWREALTTLAKEDHYILVMTQEAFGGGSSPIRQTRPRDFLIYIAVGLGVVVLILVLELKLGH